jgi:excinuclease ABC subunit C
LPGVYWFLEKENKVLYVGKAKNLKKRLSQYTQLKRLPLKIKSMVLLADQVKFKTLSSELEALLIEAELIRLHQPNFNSQLKDDKSPIYVLITQENYPKVLTIRKKDLDRTKVRGTILGPFPSSYKIKEVLKLVRKIFTWCDNPIALNKTHRQQACFYYHLDQCPGACLGKISSQDYQENIKQLILFLKGKKKTVIKNIKAKLKESSANMEYEKASFFRDQLTMIKDVTSNHFQLQPTLILPNLINQTKAQSLLNLRKLLSTYMPLPKSYLLNRIEGYDVSNTSGKLASVAMVVFINGQPVKKEYKLFNIKTLTTPNDYQMLKEALLRRQNHPEWGKPDLIIIDGGKGQLRAALNVWQWHAPVISIVKNPDRIIIPNQLAKKKSNRLAITYKVITMPKTHPTLHLTQHIRNESHRFSKKQHQRRRLKEMFN